MLTHPQIKHLRALGNKKYREETGRFLAEGHKLVTELCASRLRVCAVYATAEWLSANGGPACDPAIPVFTIPPHIMEKVTQFATPSPVMAEVCIPVPGPGPEYRGGLVLALDGIRDPGNLGTILRVADWFGIGEVVCSPDCVEVWNPKVVHSTMGSIARIRTSSCNLPEFLASAAAATQDLPVYGAFLEGENIFQSCLSEEGVLVIGNESRGISSALDPFITRRLRIPSFGDVAGGKAESLNASVATAVICAEFRRRITSPG